jgi:hypothetical protein
MCTPRSRCGREGKQENSILKNEKKKSFGIRGTYISGTGEKLGKISKKNSLLFLRGK